LTEIIFIFWNQEHNVGAKSQLFLQTWLKVTFMQQEFYMLFKKRKQKKKGF
jgi:hypothetical protein